MDSPAFTDYDYLVKTILVGDSGVGKSCLLKRFTRNEFADHHLSTIGVDFGVKTIDLDGKVAKLQIWDTAGQERFRSITSSYYKGANVVLVVCDVTNPDSFKNVKKWMEEIKKYANEDVQVLIVANKTDDMRHRLIDQAEANEVANELGLPYIETSAKNSSNVEEAFFSIAKTFIKKRVLRLSPDSNGVQPGPGVSLSRSSFNFLKCCS